jgi:Xaa-Pro aminopeptidase
VAYACREALETAGLAMESAFDTFEPDVDEYRVTQDFYYWN